MVNFKWGTQNLSLPKSESFIYTQMRDYVLDGDKVFRNKLKKAKQSVEDNPQSKSELKEQLTSILTKVLDEPIKPILERDTEAWKGFSRKRDKTINEANVTFIEDKKIGDITNAKVLGRLKGTDVSFIRGGKTKLPDFDFNDWYSTQDESSDDLNVSTDISFREHGSLNDRFVYAHNDRLSGLDAHMEVLYPRFDEGKLLNAKADYILETTGQEAKPKLMKQKFKAGTEVIDYSFEVPDSVIQELKGVSSRPNYVVEQEVTEEDGKMKFTDKGQKIEFTSNPEDEINDNNVLPALKDLDRTDDMKAEDIIRLNGKYYFVRYVVASDDNKTARLNFSGFGAGTPEGFFEDNATQQIIERIINKYLVVPDEVYTVKIYGNIKTKKSTKPSYKEYALATQAKKDAPKLRGMGPKGKTLSVKDIEEQSNRAYSHKTEKEEKYTNLETGEKITLGEYNKLEDDETSKYTNKKFISETDYNALSSSEKENYNSEIRVFEDVEVPGKIKFKESKDYGQEEVSTQSIPLGQIQEAFKEAFVELTFEVTKHGEFNLSGARGRQNRSMANYSNKIKKNVRKLKRIIGV